MKKISKYHRLLIYTLTIVLSGAIIGVGLIHLFVSSNQSVDTNMITLLSIIVTLGVGYSFYSIYQVSHDFYRLKVKTKHIQSEIQKQSEKLNKQSYSLDRRLELYKRNLAAENDFRNRKFLRALKKEVEIVVYVLKNSEHLTGKLTKSENEFISSIGIKRSFIANDILNCIRHLTLQKLSKFKEKEFRDTQETLFSAIHEIKYTNELWSLITCEEQKRYQFLFNVIQDLLNCIVSSQFPLRLEEDKIYKLHFYHDGILEGHKSDNDNNMEQWISDFKKKQSEEAEKCNPNQNNYY